ncbi:MAG TPA: hypothetical protein VFQ39_07150 [Longimicrobium sp.]|nr:hypothetical protein [Longimicrobium sp.]
MDRIFGWPLVVWMARIALVTVMGCGAWMLIVLLARYFRPKHVWALMKADLPRLTEVGGEFAGARATVKFEGQNRALDALAERVAALEAAAETQRSLLDKTTRLVEEQRQ